MPSVKIEKTHVIRGCILLLGAGLLIWYAFPSWVYHNYHQEVVEMEGSDTLLDGGKIEREKLYKSQGKLKFKGGQLYLDRKPIRIISGAVHYFRIFPQYWNDTFMRMKACGLNTVETYVAWNLHEPHPGQFIFDGNHGLLNLRGFIESAQAHGLYVILRPGPYICSEWEFGGMPSWLLADPNMKVRSNYKPYLDAAGRYLGALMSYIGHLQYSRGGPIIAFQVENEFGSYSSESEHLLRIKKMLEQSGVLEMIFTSDGINYNNDIGMKVSPFYYEALPTVNFGRYEKTGERLFKFVKNLSSEFPLINMEFWDGWFDHWGVKPSTGPPLDEMKQSLLKIFEAGASVNFYMFHGGTNFGFMNGANYFTDYLPTVTSYDYLAPLSEAGDITAKYRMMQEIIHNYIPKPRALSNVPVPASLPNRPKGSYGTVHTISHLSFEHILENLSEKEKTQHNRLVLMEDLKLSEHGYGQSYGFILYRKKVPQIKELTIHGIMKDRMQIFMNGKEVAVFDRQDKSYKVDFATNRVFMDVQNNVLDLLVENQGRVNYVTVGSPVLNEERKGIQGQAFIDNQKEELSDWSIFSLDFSDSFMNRVWIHQDYKPIPTSAVGPALYKAELQITDEPKETFISLEGWTKGVVFINNFNLGRYWKIGPQQTLYVPGAILKKGHNAIRIFEQHKAGDSVKFVDTPVLQILEKQTTDGKK